MIVYQVDAFTDRPFAGNPASVCILSEARSDAWMQRVAREMGRSETAYLLRESGAWRLRWFTPSTEVDLCGHATLASAHVLWEMGVAHPEEPLRFRTLSGDLLASRRGDWIELDFPAEPAKASPQPPGLTEALGVMPRWVGRNRLDYLVEVASDEEVRAMVPDFVAIRKTGGRGIIVTGRSRAPEFDFVSRYFAPAVGVMEDPVTGSSHCGLGPYWAEKLGKTEMTAFQASERGGVLKVRVGEGRVYIGGQAVTVMRSELLTPALGPQG